MWIAVLRLFFPFGFCSFAHSLLFGLSGEHEHLPVALDPSSQIRYAVVLVLVGLLRYESPRYSDDFACAIWCIAAARCGLII